MSLKKIDETGLQKWVEGLIQDTKVIAPQSRSDRFDFAELEDAQHLRLDYDVSLTPPNKVCFQPPEEVIARFKGIDYQSEFDDEPFVLLGVHPYDMVAINQMDKVFTTDNYDEHYMSRRNAATIVACDVQTVSENVFASGMSTATCDEGFDVLLSRIEGGYIVDARTEKGERLCEGLADAGEPTDEDLKARQQLWEDNEERLSRHEVNFDPEQLPELLGRKEKENHPVWKEKAELCFSCGSCTNVCPTCYCFDVQEDVNWDMESGERKRRWDGCQLVSFAEVAGSHNFRPEPYQRYRHRYYRKGKYVPEMIGECACVGCGRCITACVAKIANPPEIYNRLMEDE